MVIPCGLKLGPMSVIDTLLGDIDAAIRGTGERRRHALLRRATAMLIDHLGNLSDHDLSVFDDVMVSLVLDVDTETRAELADKLADLPRVPRKTLRILACDESISVARPVIERSLFCDDETLSAIIEKRDAPFLNIIAKRRALSTSVIAQLVARADESLLVDLARNESIQISDDALRLFAERALSHPQLYRVLRSRPDFAMRHIGALIEAARYRAQADAITRDINDDMLSRALAIEIAQKISKTTEISLAHSSLRERGLFGPANLDDMLEHDQINEALATLAADMGISNETAKRVFHAPHHEPLMFLLRAQDYPLPTLMNFMRLKHGSLSEDFAAQLGNAYCALARETALRIASFMADKKPLSADDRKVPEPLRHSA